jgi:hypothetical protein
MHSLRPCNLRQHVTAAPSATRDTCDSMLLLLRLRARFHKTRDTRCPPNFCSAVFFLSLSCARLFFLAPHIFLFRAHMCRPKLSRTILLSHAHICQPNLSLFASSSNEHVRRTRPWQRVRLRSPALRGCGQVPVENSCHSKMIRVMVTYPAQTCGSLGVDCLGESGF